MGPVLHWKSGRTINQEKTADSWPKYMLSHFSAPHWVCLSGHSALCSAHITHGLLVPSSLFLPSTQNSTHGPTAVILLTRRSSRNPRWPCLCASNITSRLRLLSLNMHWNFGSRLLQLQALVKDGALDHCCSWEFFFFFCK